MGFGNCVLANDVPEHREVLGEAGIFFSTLKENDLRDKIQYLIDNPKVVINYKRLAIKKIKENFTWDKVTKDYEKLFFRLSS